MNFLITEQQLNLIVESEKNSKLTTNMKELHSFTYNLVNRVKRAWGLNFKFLVTWGTAIGGLVAPLDRYIREGEFDLSDDAISLILIGVAATYFFQNKKEIKNLFNTIKEEGLVDVFKKVLTKSDELKNSFTSFLESLSLTLGATVEMVHYAFIIPIISDLIKISHSEGSSWDTAETIVERLLASGVVLVSGQILVEVIKKILQRVRR